MQQSKHNLQMCLAAYIFCNIAGGGMDTSNEKRNRKIRYTKMVLRDSLMELMQTKSILRITVKDLCDTADICRTTFYAHYKDQYDLLKQIEEETIAYFEDMLNKFTAANSSQTKNRGNREMVEEVLRHIVNNAGLIRVLLGENGSADFHNKIYSRITLKMKKLDTHHGDKDKNTKENLFYSVFMINGAINLIQFWLKDSMDVSVPELAKMLVNLTRELWQ
jgi:AcrR family transcriptional regulator